MKSWKSNRTPSLRAGLCLPYRGKSSQSSTSTFAIHDKEDGNPQVYILLIMQAMDEIGKCLSKSRKVYVPNEDGETWWQGIPKKE